MNHDAPSKALFALPSVEADLLRIVAAGWVHLLAAEQSAECSILEIVC